MTARLSEPSRLAASVQASLEGVEEALSLDDNRAALMVAGNYDQNIAHLERRLNVVVHLNGNRLLFRGAREAVDHARRVVESLYASARRGKAISPGDVDGAIEETALQRRLFPEAPRGEASQPAIGDPQGFGQISTRKKTVKARNAAQDSYLRVLARNELVFAEGPAGTGKTWLAVGHAVHLLEQGHVERVILSRPAVEAGEKIGFLPGDMRDKVDPYLRPIYDALYDFMESRMVEKAMQTNVIEVAPLAFMRGRTLSNALVLLDEAQNASSMQMKMFLTRLGEGSRMIVTGDPTQVDLPPGQKSGFAEAVALLSEVEGIGHVKFGHQHVVRHDLVRRIVKAYEDDAATPGWAVAEIDVLVEAEGWTEIGDVEALTVTVARAALDAAGTGRTRPSLTVLLETDAAIRALNRDWRGKDQPTNVLSFPAGPGAEPGFLGDIALALETCRTEAQAEGRPLADHLSHLVVHGVLHLLGHDHEDDAAAEAMETLETAILAGLGVPDPYSEPTGKRPG